MALTCYNCGEPGHFMGICKKLKVCFICSIPGHYMTDCLEWMKPQPIATYTGSASSGLWFYHVDLLDGENTGCMNISNCAVVLIKRETYLLQSLRRNYLISSVKNA
jgi:hypothetical protein